VTRHYAMNPEEGDVHAQLYFEKEQSCEVEEGILNLGRMHERQVAKISIVRSSIVDDK
jgi:hypothetical protein